jgi:nucleoporin SEH1
MEFEFIGSHNDVVNDIAFDFYGRRFATCSLDKHIKIWALKEPDMVAGSVSSVSGNANASVISGATIDGNSLTAGAHSISHTENSQFHWCSSDIPTAHQNAIWRLSWAHPEFGQLLASCSDDHTACIWEEQEVITRAKRTADDGTGTGTGTGASGAPTSAAGTAAPGGANAAEAVSSATASALTSRGAAGTSKASVGPAAVKDHREPASRWIRKATLSDSKRAVRDVKFAPRHLGLMVACASADGTVRVYEATDVFSLNIWQLQHTIQVEQTVNIFSDAPIAGGAVAGVTAGSAGSVGSSSSSSSSSSGAAGGATNANSTHVPSSSSSYRPEVMGKSEQGLTCIAWNLCPFEPAKIAVGGYSGRAVVVSLEDGKWVEECVLGESSGAGPGAGPGAGAGAGAGTGTGAGAGAGAGMGAGAGTGGVIHDIAWAPTMGRNYHQIATASRETCFKVHTMHRTSTGKIVYAKTQAVESPSVVWRVAWNATGTVLATSSEDGTLALWRTNYMGEWRVVQTLPASASSATCALSLENRTTFYKMDSK